MSKASLHLPLAISLAVHAAAGTLAVRAMHSEAKAPLAHAEDPGGGGDSFDVPDEIALAGEPPSNLPVSPAEAQHTMPRGARTSGRSGLGAHGTMGVPRDPVVFGAAGERGSVDLATAFTRGFPQAASTDPVWARVPIGTAGEADVILDIDDAGSLVASQIVGSPSPALRAGIARTLALIGARAFTSTAPRTRLHLVATVSPNDVHDGLHGDVFAISGGGSFVAPEGNAFFALAIGRRIDLRVRVRP